MGNLRIQKINNNLQKILSEIIKEKVSEEIPFTSVNFINTSKDLKICKVYLGFISKNKTEAFDKFDKFIPQIKKEFSKKANIKYTPILEFYIDDKQNQINKVEKLLDKISKK